MEARQLLRSVAPAVGGDSVRTRRWIAAALTIVVGSIVVTTIAAGQTGEPLAPRVEASVRPPDGKPRLRSDVELDSRPVSGGCVVRASGSVLVEILTPFGRTFFARCTLRFTAHVRLDGVVALDDMRVSGESVCADIRPCREETDPTPRPWIGRFEPHAGGFRMNVDACLDTCAGWFEGPLLLPVDRTDGLRVSGDRAQIGESGLELTGDWKLRGDDIEFERIAPPR